MTFLHGCTFDKIRLGQYVQTSEECMSIGNLNFTFVMSTVYYGSVELLLKDTFFSFFFEWDIFEELKVP